MITAMGDVMRRAYEKGWITTRDGNISLRRSGTDIMYVTPSGWRKTIIHPEHMIKVKLTNEGVDIIDSHAKPSGELDMHVMLQRHHKKTKAIVPVHLYGQSCDMAPIIKLAEKHKLKIIEDNAQAIGCKYTFPNGKIKFTGILGHIGTTSFYPSKNLGCFGDGGAVFTNDREIYELANSSHIHGMGK